MWTADAVVYHVYALGALGAPYHNDYWGNEDAQGQAAEGQAAEGQAAEGQDAKGQTVPRLDRIVAELDRLRELGITTLLIGPVFEAMSHGYDTVDYTRVDRRFGDDSTLRHLSEELTARDMNLMLDAVLNHVGREFFAFADLRANGPRSPYSDWFHVDFEHDNAYLDGFSYRSWGDSPALVELNLDHPEVRDYLLEVVDGWVMRYNVAGLRLDAANVMSRAFLAALAKHVRTRWPHLGLVGEQVEGDYRELAGPAMLDSVTNYWAFDSLWRGHRDHNYPLIADCLQRQFGPLGQYRGLPLLNFADNHDVSRIASAVGERAALYPLYGILTTMPGVPAIYYGSEWAIPGVMDPSLRPPSRDLPMRPALDDIEPVDADLPSALRRLLTVRHELPALRAGGYETIHVAADQLAFWRGCAGAQPVVVAVNNADSWVQIPVDRGGQGYDHLEQSAVNLADGRVWVPPRWLRIITEL